MPHVGGLRLRLRRNLVSDSPQFTLGRFDLDYVGTEVGQDHRRSGTSDEARKIDNLQSGENVVSGVCIFSFHNRFWVFLTSAAVKLSGAFLQERLCSLFLVFCSRAESEERRFQ